jgi:predicted small lipoprotein YifL
MTRSTIGALAVLAVVISGCGLKGPLYLPEKSGDVAIRPAPAPQPPATTTEPAAPDKPATPAPPPQEPPTGTDRG